MLKIYNLKDKQEYIKEVVKLEHNEWAENKEERLNPENGLCLSSLYDKAFDRGYISLDNQYRVIIAEKLKLYHREPYYEKHFASIEGTTIHLPEYHRPNKTFLEWHRDTIFNQGHDT